MKSFREESVAQYVVEINGPYAEALERCRIETEPLANAGFQISPDQGRFMGWLAGVIGAQRYLEVGTFTGYSAMAVLLGAGPAATAVCLDVSEEFTAHARRHWAHAGLTDRIDLRLAPALETLATLTTGEFDMAFIDADKPSYPAYYEECLRVVRPGGVILLDNVLWSGRVADSEENDNDTRMFRTLNRQIRNDPLVETTLTPTGDGLLLCRVR